MSVVGGCSFGGDPGQILGQAVLQWDCNDFGKFIWMLLANGRFKLGDSVPLSS